MIFTYRSKGSADDWTTEEIEAASQNEAVAKLDEIYGVTRDANGTQTNRHVVEVELVETKEE